VGTSHTATTCQFAVDLQRHLPRTGFTRAKCIVRQTERLGFIHELQGKFQFPAILRGLGLGHEALNLSHRVGNVARFFANRSLHFIYGAVHAARSPVHDPIGSPGNSGNFPLHRRLGVRSQVSQHLLRIAVEWTVGGGLLASRIEQLVGDVHLAITLQPLRLLHQVLSFLLGPLPGVDARTRTLRILIPLADQRLNSVRRIFVDRVGAAHLTHLSHQTLGHFHLAPRQGSASIAQQSKRIPIAVIRSARRRWHGNVRHRFFVGCS